MIGLNRAEECGSSKKATRFEISAENFYYYYKFSLVATLIALRTPSCVYTLTVISCSERPAV